LIGQVSAPWQLYPCFVLIGVGWSTLSTTGIAATVAPWFERHQGRSMTLAIMGASLGAITGVPLLLLAVARFGLASGLIVTATGAALVLLPLIALALRFRSPPTSASTATAMLPRSIARSRRPSGRWRHRAIAVCCCGVPPWASRWG
ncbi:MAG TPA: hypothetical protein VGO42_10865, partial [Reyranella sp.]|nr:hypothetical protein [Reyranella sp.]